MTEFTPIIRHCDLCGKDMSIHSLADQYPVSIYSDGLNLCGACFCVHTNTEPVDISGYEPHHLVWPDDVATDDEDYDSEQLTADEPMQLEMFAELAG